MTGIIYLSKNGLALYDEKTKGIVKLNFKPEAVKDLEVINSEQLGLQIKSLVDANKIAPTPLIMVVSHDMFFEKDFPALAKEQQEIETQKFLDNIPFEVVVSKSFGSEKAYKIIAANGYFIEAVRKAFESLGFNVNIALPFILFGNIGEELNEATIKIIFNKYPSLKQYNLLNASSEIHVSPSQKEQDEEKSGDKTEEKNNVKDNKKNLITIGIFVLFLIVLIVIVFVVLSSQ